MNLFFKWVIMPIMIYIFTCGIFNMITDIKQTDLEPKIMFDENNPNIKKIEYLDNGTILIYLDTHGQTQQRVNE